MVVGYESTIRTTEICQEILMPEFGVTEDATQALLRMLVARVDVETGVF